jgi:CIC family chloride channel protein
VNADGRLAGVVTIEDLLKGRENQTHREEDRERVLRLRWPFGGREAAQAVAEAQATDQEKGEETDALV